MKIWTIVYNDDNGATVDVVNTQELADHMATVWVSLAWTEVMGTVPVPPSWQEAYDRLVEAPGFMDSISVMEHDVFAPIPTDPIDKAYIEAARRHFENDGVLEIDDNAVVSVGDDPGAYVQAWVWVEAEDAGI